MKVVVVLFCLLIAVMFAYAVLGWFIMGVCWVTGLPPEHLIPGMAPYSEWRIK